MFLLSLIIFGFLSVKPIYAQDSLYYQLIDAYHPSTDTYTPMPIAPTPPTGVTVTPTPLPVTYGKTITIAVLGDSMIDTLLPGIPRLRTSLNQYFPGRNFQILNYGVGSRDVEYGIYRLSHDYDYRGQHFPNLISQNPDIVVVESFAYNNFGNTESGINHYLTDLTTLTDTIKLKLPHAKILIAATIAPNSITFANGIPDVHYTALEKIEKTSTIKLYLQNAVNFAASRGFPLADAFHLSLFGDDGLKDFISPGDNLHPSASGGQFFCDTLADTSYKNHLVD